MRLQDNLYFRSINKYKFNSVFSKTFIGYICILILFVFSSAFTYYYIRDVLIKKEINASKDYLKYNARIVDNGFLQLQESIYVFLKNSKNISRIHDIYSASEQYELVEELNRFKHNFKLVDKCFLYSKELPLVLSNDGSIDKSLMYGMFQEGDRIKNAIEESSVFQFIPTSKVSYYTASQDELISKHVIVLAAGLNYSDNNNRLLIMVDEDDIRSIIKDTNIINYGSVFIVDGASNILSSSKSDKVSSKFDQQVLNLIKEQSDSSNYVMYQNNLIVYEQSKFSNMYYITVIPYSNCYTAN